MSADSHSNTVSKNAKQIVLSVVAAATSIACIAIFAPDAALAEKIAIPFITGIIGYGSGIISALWGK